MKDLREVLLYEIYSSWWAPLIGFPWLQELASSYFIWKARRKWTRYQARLLLAGALEKKQYGS
jgi:hypothetical protein